MGRQMRAVVEVSKIVLGVIIGAAIVAVLNINFHITDATSALRPINLSYADLAAINLTVATVVLGGVALIVAVAAVFGFQVIRSESVSGAETRVKTDLPNLVEKELRRMENDGRLTRALERAVYSGSSTEDADGNSSQQD
jgi:hypothetical protein